MFDYWQKQITSKPLYPEIEWEKPTRKDIAGKLLIIGGSTGSFSGVADAYATSKAAEIGEVKAVIPETLRKPTKDLPDIMYAPSNTSGSFSTKSKEILLYSSQWADGVLLSGEYGRNSESAIALAYLIKNYKGLVKINENYLWLSNVQMENLQHHP